MPAAVRTPAGSARVVPRLMVQTPCTAATRRGSFSVRDREDLPIGCHRHRKTREMALACRLRDARSCATGSPSSTTRSRSRRRWPTASPIAATTRTRFGSRPRGARRDRARRGRPARHRPADAGARRPRAARRRARAQPRRPGDRDDRVRRDRLGGRGDPQGRVPLPHQAVQARRARGVRRARARPSARCGARPTRCARGGPRALLDRGPRRGRARRCSACSPWSSASRAPTRRS